LDGPDVEGRLSSFSRSRAVKWPDGRTEQVSETPSRIVAVVRERLPNAMFRVELPGGRSATAHVAGEARARLTRLVAGDAVLVEVSEFDAHACRIVGRAPGARGR
jgi:translation initiation factor IF-1